MNPSPTPAPALLRLFRSLVLIALALAFMLIAALFFAGTTFSVVDTYFNANGPSDRLLAALGIIVALVPLALMFWAARRQWLTWRVIGAGSLAAAAILGWLAWDDTVLRHPLTVDEVAPAFDGAEKSYAVLMEYGKQNPTEDSKAFSARKQTIFFSKAGPGDGDQWVEFLEKNRAGFEAEWAVAGPQRTWLGRLNAFDRLGDLTPADFAADIPRFDVWRFLAQRTAAIASLQAIEGKGDEAVATLLPMLEVSRKFETSSRTLVRLMIARVAQKLCYQTAGFILDRGRPGPAARARLLAAVESGNGAAGARRIVQVEYVFFTPILARLSFSEAMSVVSWGSNKQLPGVLNLLTRFLINPCATANLYGDQVHELAVLAEARDLGSFAARQQAFNHATLQGGMKNLGGRLLLNMATPAYQKVLKSYWDIEDLRVALATRLSAAP